MVCFVALKKEIPSIVEPVHLRSQELLVIGTMKSVSESRVVGVVVIRFLGFFPPAMDIHPQITRFGIADDRRARVRSTLAGQRFETGHRSALAQSFFSIQTPDQNSFAALSPSESADSAEFFACYSPLLVPCSVARCPACIRLSSPARAVSRISPRQSNPCRTHGSLPIVRAAARDADICRLTFPGTTFPGLLDEARANLRSAVGN